jgi:chromosome segregation ATPase
MGMRVRTIKGLDEAETLERIESLEEAAMKLDNQISQASFEHEEEKSRILASLRAKKEEIMHNAVSIKHQRETAKAQEIAEQKAALEREISQLHQVSRTDSLGLTTLRKQTEQLQLTARQETERVCELLRRRETLHREAELQQKKIEETEIELGLLKGRVFAMD